MSNRKFSYSDVIGTILGFTVVMYFVSLTNKWMQELFGVRGGHIALGIILLGTACILVYRAFWEAAEDDDDENCDDLGDDTIGGDDTDIYKPQGSHLIAGDMLVMSYANYKLLIDAEVDARMRASKAEIELRRIDLMLNSRPALDGKSRIEAIAYAIETARIRDRERRSGLSVPESPTDS